MQDSGGRRDRQPEAHAGASRDADEIQPCGHATGHTAVDVASSAPGAGASRRRLQGGGVGGAIAGRGGVGRRGIEGRGEVEGEVRGGGG